MIKGRKLGHIGLGTNDIDATVNYYIHVLGFELIGDFKSPADEPIKFLKMGDMVYEIYTPNGGVATPARSTTSAWNPRTSRLTTATVWSKATRCVPTASRSCPQYGKRACATSSC